MSIFGDYYAKIITFFKIKDHLALRSELERHIFPILLPRKNLSRLKHAMLEKISSFVTEDRNKLILLLDFYQLIASIEPIDCTLSKLEEHAIKYLDQDSGKWKEQAKLFIEKIEQMQKESDHLTALGITWRVAEFCESYLAPGYYGFYFYPADTLRDGIEQIVSKIKISTQLKMHYPFPIALMSHLDPFKKELSDKVYDLNLYTQFVNELNAALNAYIKVAQEEYSALGNWIKQANTLIVQLSQRTSENIQELKEDVEKFCESQLKGSVASSRRLKAMLTAITSKIISSDLKPRARPLSDELCWRLKLALSADATREDFHELMHQFREIKLSEKKDSYNELQSKSELTDFYDNISEAPKLTI